MGHSAIAEEKCDHGSKLVILGVQVESGFKGYRLSTAQCKVRKWVKLIQRALWDDKLSPGDASKLAGKLAWSCAHVFQQLGRAQLRPIFDQTTRRDGVMGDELREALQWWCDILRMDLAQVYEWEQNTSRIAHLFCDASGKEAHMGAVLSLDGACYWTHDGVTAQQMKHFRRRGDKQILGLELLGIALGLSTFAELLAGRRVVIHCDNSGAEARSVNLLFGCVCICVCVCGVRVLVMVKCLRARACHVGGNEAGDREEVRPCTTSAGLRKLSAGKG